MKIFVVFLLLEAVIAYQLGDFNFDHEFSVLIRAQVQSSPIKINETCVFEAFKKVNPGNVLESEIEAMKVKLQGDLDDDLKKKLAMVNAALPICIENEIETHKKFFSVVFYEPAKHRRVLTLACAKAALALYSTDTETPSDCQVIPRVYKPIPKEDELTSETCKAIQRNFNSMIKLKCMILVITNASEAEIEKERNNFARDFRDLNTFMFSCIVNTING